MKKRILAFLLALVMIVGILPMTAFAEAKFPKREHWSKFA